MCSWLGKPELCGHAGCFSAFFFLWNASIEAPNYFHWLFVWLLFFSLPLSFTHQSKLWLCKEFPAKNLSKHLVLRAGKLPQYSSNWSHASLDPYISVIYRKARIQAFDTKVKNRVCGTVHTQRPLGGIFIYWFRVIQSVYVFCYMPKDLPTSWKFSTLTLHLKIFLPAIHLELPLDSADFCGTIWKALVGAVK